MSMKRLYTIFVAILLLSVSLNAQPFQSPVKTVPISAAEGQAWWNNHDKNENKWGRTGTGILERYSVATYIPANFFPGEGITISAISIYPVSEDMDNVQIWISKKLPEFGNSADMETVDVAKKDLTLEAFNDISFSTAHVIPEEGVYVGYSFDITGVTNYNHRDAYLPVLYSTTISDREKGFLMCTEHSPLWSEEKGNLLMRVLLGGELFGNAAKAHDFITGYTTPEGVVNIPVTIENMGTNAITSIKYAISSDGEEVEEGTQYLEISDFKGVSTFTIMLKAGSAAGVSKKTFTIKEVNGVPNELSDNAGYGKVISIANKPKVFPVVEEFTGTWCQYCPYGIVAMEKAHEQYGDNVALIAVHALNSDPMEISEYSPITKSVESYPSATLNRDVSFYPTSASLLRKIDEAMNNVAPGEIEAKAVWGNRAKSNISIDTKTTFVYSEDDAHYGIAYVLVEDGLTNPDWYQTNNLSGKSGDSQYDFWYNADRYVYGLEFNHVAVAGWDVYKGVNGSVSSVVVEGQPMDYNFVADISSKSLIQDKSRLKLIVMLVDSQSGKIMNASMTTIETPEFASIPGDADGTGSVDNNDVVTIANYLMGKALDVFDREAADLNSDGKVDLADIVMLINMLLSVQPQ